MAGETDYCCGIVGTFIAAVALSLGTCKVHSDSRRLDWWNSNCVSNIGDRGTSCKLLEAVETGLLKCGIVL